MSTHQFFLFCYGTLEDPDVMQKVTGSHFRGKNAILDGYARYQVKGVVYPAIIQQSDAQVYGTVFQGLNEIDLEKLDAYEGPVYSRVSLPVLLDDGSRAQAMVYVYPLSCRHLLHDHDWDPERFRDQYKIKYMASI